MIELIYTSRAVRPFSAAQLSDLLVLSREKNHLRNLTGMLLYYDGAFMQVLEGEPANVDALFERIRQDPRHTDVVVGVRSQIRQRSFSNWTMGFYQVDPRTVGELPGFVDFFGPHFARDMFESLSPSLARRLLLRFANGEWHERVESDAAASPVT